MSAAEDKNKPSLTPAIPRRWYCNKCGHLGDDGPGHIVRASCDGQQCQYNAIPNGPYWDEAQVLEMLRAERERCAVTWEKLAAAALPGERIDDVIRRYADVMRC